MHRTSIALGVAVLAASFVAVPAGGQTVRTEFPIEAGTSWVYTGTVRQQLVESPEVESSTITLKMEITASEQRGDLTVATLRGFFSDLAFSDDDGPGDYLIVHTASGNYHVLAGITEDELFASAVDPGRFAETLNEHQLLVLDFPLTSDKTYAPMEPDVDRTDTMYAWHVDSVRRARLRGIEGVSSRRIVTEYILALRTLPDHEIDTFVPGIGITRFVYSHHGTVMDVDLHLVRFHRGTRQP